MVQKGDTLENFVYAASTGRLNQALAQNIPPAFQDPGLAGNYNICACGATLAAGEPAHQQPALQPKQDFAFG